MAAALLALGDLMALPARLAPVFASGLHPSSLGLSAMLLGKLAAGAGLVLVACFLLLPGTTARDACSRRLVRVLLATILTLAALDLLFELLSARWPSSRLDLAEETIETLVTAWPLSVAVSSTRKLQFGTNQDPAAQPNRLTSLLQTCSGGCGNEAVSSQDYARVDLWTAS
jgi:hypothetical protein